MKDIRNNEKGYRPFDVLSRPKPDENWPYPHHPNNPNDRVYGNKAPKFIKHVFLRRDQVMFDVDAQISIITGVRQKEDGTEDDKMTSATTTYKQQFARWFEKHLALCKKVLTAFLLEKSIQAKMNTVSEAEEIDLELQFSETWDDTVFPQLVQSIHEYLVNAILYEYFLLSLTSKDPVTIDKGILSNEALHDVKVMANAVKPNRVHKVLKPF